MKKEFQQIAWEERLEDDWHSLLRLAMAEDLGDAGDLTTRALVPEDAFGVAEFVARSPGVLAGMAAAEMAADYVDARLQWTPELEDGSPLAAGDRMARIEGPADSLLTAERLMLNVLSRLSGIATLTARYVEATADTKARIYDTRKTTPAWRRLEKYAVRCGGGRNHRRGLFEAILIKDNHLALGAQAPLDGSGRSGSPSAYTPAQAVRRARRFIETHVPQPSRSEIIVEIEVDTLEQLDEVLTAGPDTTGPDIVLLDNMTPGQLAEAVRRRDDAGADTHLEASGGVNLETVREIALSGIDRISVGELTHSAVALDIGLDWVNG